MKKFFSCCLRGVATVFLLTVGLLIVLVCWSRLNASEPGPVANVLQPFVDHHNIAGAVLLIADKHQVLDVGAVGYADIAAKKPMDPHAMFWIASMTKSMTAAALMMLVDEGKLSLEDPVEKYVPEFAGDMIVDPKDPTHTPKKPLHPVTVRELLYHGSGLPPNGTLEGKTPILDQHPLQVLAASYGKLPLQFEPGTSFLYSNAGFNTAGRIVGILGGMPYEDFMQQRLLGPLGMTDTTFWPTDEQVTRLAQSYRYDKATQDLLEMPIANLTYPLTDRTHRFPFPAGGLFSTAVDVSKFCQMILNGGVGPDGKRLLSENAVKEMTTRQTLPTVPPPYGFGLDVGLGHIVHNGAYATSMRMDPKLGFVAVFMVQYSGAFPHKEDQQYTAAYMQAATSFMIQKKIRDYLPKPAPAAKP